MCKTKSVSHEEPRKFDYVQAARRLKKSRYQKKLDGYRDGWADGWADGRCEYYGSDADVAIGGKIASSEYQQGYRTGWDMAQKQAMTIGDCPMCSRRAVRMAENVFLHDGNIVWNGESPEEKADWAESCRLTELRNNATSDAERASVDKQLKATQLKSLKTRLEELLEYADELRRSIAMQEGQPQ